MWKNVFSSVCHCNLSQLLPRSGLLLGRDAKDERVHILGLHVDFDLHLVAGRFHHVGDQGDDILAFQQFDLHQKAVAAHAP